MRVSIIISTGGSVIKQTARHPLFKEMVKKIYIDRQCAFEKDCLSNSELNRLSTVVYSDCPDHLYSRLSDIWSSNPNEKPEWLLLFYLDYPCSIMREEFRDKIINFHPSLLPAFPGFDVDYQSRHLKPRIIGSSVEIIRNRMDQGLLLAQTATFYDPSETYAMARHRIYIQQCCSFLQVLRWIQNDQICVEGDYAIVKSGKYISSQFSPEIAPDIVEWVHNHSSCNAPNS
jgi:phosphoribosylglycinamide formyltransferase-1